MEYVKKIVIVAPELHRELADRLSGEFLKFQGIESPVWTIEHFEDNKFLPSGNNYLLILGHPDDNNVQKYLLGKKQKKLKAQAGANYGYDANTAHIFGDGSWDSISSFFELGRRCSDLIGFFSKDTTGINSHGHYGCDIARSLGLSPRISAKILCLSPGYYSEVGVAGKLFNPLNTSSLNLKEEQMQIGLFMFLTECFDAWICSCKE